jgi:hypothetical protein
VDVDDELSDDTVALYRQLASALGAGLHRRVPDPPERPTSDLRSAVPSVEASREVDDSGEHRCKGPGK